MSKPIRLTEESALWTVAKSGLVISWIPLARRFERLHYGYLRRGILFRVKTFNQSDERHDLQKRTGLRAQLKAGATAMRSLQNCIMPGVIS